MKKLRIAGVMAAFCLLQGGCGAEQETTDAFQAKAADTVQIAKDSSGLTKMPEGQSAALKGYAVFHYGSLRGQIYCRRDGYGFHGKCGAGTRAGTVYQ